MTDERISELRKEWEEMIETSGKLSAYRLFYAKILEKVNKEDDLITIKVHYIMLK